MRRSVNEEVTARPSALPSDTKVGYDKSVDLVLTAAREYFNSSADLKDSCMELARSENLSRFNKSVTRISVDLKDNRVSVDFKDYRVLVILKYKRVSPDLTLPMLRLLLSKAHGCKDF